MRPLLFFSIFSASSTYLAAPAAQDKANNQEHTVHRSQRFVQQGSCAPQLIYVLCLCIAHNSFVAMKE